MINKPIKLLKHILIFLSVLLFVAITAFILNFWNASFSNDTKQWSEFGDYIGGVINTIISIASLVVLGTLTYYVADNSNKKSEQLQLLKKKQEIYDELCLNFLQIKIGLTQYEMMIEVIKIYHDLQKDRVNLYESLNYFEVSKKITSVINYLELFNLRNEFYFKEVNNSIQYSNLTQLTTLLKNKIQQIDLLYISNKPISRDFDLTNKKEYLSCFEDFIRLAKKNIFVTQSLT